MPFGFLRRKTPDEPLAAAASADGSPDPRTPREVNFEGLTDEWRLRGRLILTGRLLDALNQREPMAVTGVEWCPADGSAGFEPAPGIHAVDPYDLVLVVATPETLAPMTDEERQARRSRRVAYDVAVEVPPYRVVGTIQLHPGVEPETLLDRQTAMWFALTDPVVAFEGGDVALGAEVDALLVNRFYLRAIEQVDRAAGFSLPRLPGIAPSDRVPVVAGDGGAAAREPAPSEEAEGQG